MLTGILPDVFASLKMSYDKIKSDDTMINDIPHSGEGLFCDHPSHWQTCTPQLKGQACYGYTLIMTYRTRGRQLRRLQDDL